MTKSKEAEAQHQPASSIMLGEWILRDVEGGKQWQQVVAKDYPQIGYIRFSLQVPGYFEIYDAQPLVVREDTILEWWRAQ